MAKTERTTDGLRLALFEELDNLRAGKTTPQKASAMARLASTIVMASKLDIEYQRFVSAGESQLTAGSPRVPSLKLVKAA